MKIDTAFAPNNFVPITLTIGLESLSDYDALVHVLSCWNDQSRCSEAPVAGILANDILHQLVKAKKINSRQKGASSGA